LPRFTATTICSRSPDAFGAAFRSRFSASKLCARETEAVLVAATDAHKDGIYLVVPALIAVLVGGVVNAWLILVRLTD
jgi:hypothetical protein